MKKKKVDSFVVDGASHLNKVPDRLGAPIHTIAIVLCDCILRL